MSLYKNILQIDKANRESKEKRNKYYDYMNIIGLPIGLYAYIFPGIINLMVLDLYASKKYRILLAVLMLIIVFESVYCMLTLLLLGGLKENNPLYIWLKVGSFILILGFGIWMLLDSRNNNQAVKKNTLYRGIITVIVHPQQIPFWLIMGMVINPLLKFGMNAFALIGFIIFNAIGTLLAMTVYMVFGNKILQYFSLNLSQINRAMGFLYIAIGSYSLARFVIGQII